MTARLTRLLTTTALAISALTMGGCAMIQSNVANTTLSILEDGVTPPVLQERDVDMACNFSMVNAPLVGAARNFYGDPSLMETVMLSSAGVCSENQAMGEEMRYLRAARDKRADEAQDARIAQKRYLAAAAERQYGAFLRMKNKMEQKYFIKYGESCPKFKRDFDELVYLMGSIGGLQAIQNDIAAQQSVGVPTDVAPMVERAMNCLDNAKWWGAPQAGRATVWSIIPGAGEGHDAKTTFDSSMTIGEYKGVRLAHVMAAISAQSTDDKDRLREVIKRFAKVKDFKQNTDYRLIDAIAESQMTNISDRMWTHNTGSRTPIGSLGKFWDDKIGGDIDAGSFLN
ncbi:hypothetical protein [Aquabacterium sp.]|uniref:hypothetical protein n=1 Tax=Aquabacterium sp. TaxID=1872578 RepID=UPI0035B4A9CC